MGKNKRAVPKIRPGAAANEKRLHQVQQEHRADPQSIQAAEIRQRVDSNTTKRPTSMSKSQHQLEFIRLRNYGADKTQQRGMASSVAAFQVKITRDLFETKQRAAQALAHHRAKENDSPQFKRNKLQMPSRLDTRQCKSNITVRETRMRRHDTTTMIVGKSALSSTSLDSQVYIERMEQRVSDRFVELEKQSLNAEQNARQIEQAKRMIALEKAKLSLALYQTKKQRLKQPNSRAKRRLCKHSSLLQNLSGPESMFDERSMKDTVNELIGPMRQSSAHLNIQNLAPDSSEGEESDSDSDSRKEEGEKSTFYKKKEKSPVSRIRIQSFDSQQQRPPTQLDNEQAEIKPGNSYDSFKKKENKATFFINTQKPSLAKVKENEDDFSSNYFITQPPSSDHTSRCQFKQQQQPAPQLDVPETVLEENSFEEGQKGTDEKSNMGMLLNSASVTKLQQSPTRFTNNMQRASQTARGASRQKMSRLGPPLIATSRNYRMNVDQSKAILSSTRASEIPSSRFPFTPSQGALRHLTPALFSPLTSNCTSRQSLTLKEYQSQKDKITKLLDPKKPQPTELVEVLMPDSEHPLADLPLHKLRKVQDDISRGVPLQNVMSTESERPMQNPSQYLLSPRALQNEKLHHKKRLHWLSLYSKADKMMAITDRKRKGRTPLSLKYPNLPKKFENERSPIGLIWPHNKHPNARFCVSHDSSDENRTHETGESQCKRPVEEKEEGRQLGVMKYCQPSTHQSQKSADTDSNSSAISSLVPKAPKIRRQGSRLLGRKGKELKVEEKENGEDLFKEDTMLKSDPVMKSELLYRHVLLAGIKHAKELFLKNEKAECQSVMFDLLKLTKQAFDMPSSLRLHLCIAETWVSRDQHRDKEQIDHDNKKPKDGLHEAIKNCQVVLLMNERLELSELDNEALRITYTCLMKQGKYKEARRSLKMCLERSWITDNFEWELHVYEKLALCHFYEGNMDKAEFYLMRRELGHSEPEGTETRAVYKNIRNNYKLSKQDRFAASSNELKKTIFDEFYNHFVAAFQVIAARKERERRAEQKKQYGLQGNNANKMQQSLEAKLKEAQDSLDQLELERQQQEQQKKQGHSHLKMIAAMEEALKGKLLTTDEIMQVPLEEEIQKWAQTDEMYTRLSAYVDQVVGVRDSVVNASNSASLKHVDTAIHDELQAAREQQTQRQMKGVAQEDKKLALPKIKRELHIPLEVVIDNPMQELPSPTDERTGDQIVHLFGKKKVKTEEYVSVELLELVPHLFTSFLRKEEVFKTKSLDYRGSMGKSMQMGELIKRFRNQRAGERRPNVYLSHLSPCFHERYVSVKGEIKLVKQEKSVDEKDKVEYQTKHFLNFEKILKCQIEKANKKVFDFTPLIQSHGVRIAVYGAKKLHELMRDRRMKFTNLAAKRDVGIRKKGARRQGFHRKQYPCASRLSSMGAGFDTESHISGGERSSDTTSVVADNTRESFLERNKLQIISRQGTVRVKSQNKKEPKSPCIELSTTSMND